jgi:hypothetical protein
MEEEKNNSAPNVEPSVEEKEQEIQKKKKTFDRIFGMIKFAGFLILLALAGAFIYTRYHPVNLPSYSKENNTAVDTQPTPEIRKTVIYKSDDLKFSLEYPSEAKLIESKSSDTQTKKIEIIFAKDNDNPVNVTEKNLNEGYIFRISTFTTTNRNIDEIAKIKKESFADACPDTSTFSEIKTSLVDTVDARNFNVQNCGVDYKVTYVPRFFVYYEFLEIYKGDVGYKQLYEAKTDEILKSLKFYPEISNEKPEDPYVTFVNQQYNFSFQHPHFDDKCCELPLSTSNTARSIVVLADKNSVKDKNNFDGFGVYVDSYENGGTFNSYVDKQKQTLIDDYTVVKGMKPPQATETLIQVGGRDSILLKGYSWQGNDLIYVNLTPDAQEEQNGYILIISEKNSSGETFQKVFDKVLDSFKYKLDPKQ